LYYPLNGNLPFNNISRDKKQRVSHDNVLVQQYCNVIGWSYA
jgi:hypothetical protein